MGPSANSPPSTPSTHTPEGLAIAGNMRHVPKNLMMYGADGTGLASSSNQMVAHLPFLIYNMLCWMCLSVLQPFYVRQLDM